MNLGKIRAETQVVLGDARQARFTQEDVDLAVRWACEEAARKTGLTEGHVVLPVAAGVQVGTLASPAVDVKSILARWT